jgi:hypothetical protein
MNTDKLYTSRGNSLTDQIYDNRDKIDLLQRRVNTLRLESLNHEQRLEDIEKSRKDSTSSSLTVSKIFLKDKKKCCNIL